MITADSRALFAAIASKSTYSSGRKSRPALSCTPSVSTRSALPMYIATLIGGDGSSGSVEMLLFHDEPPNGTMFAFAVALTPGMARSAARSRVVSSIALLAVPMPVR